MGVATWSRITKSIKVFPFLCLYFSEHPHHTSKMKPKQEPRACEQLKVQFENVLQEGIVSGIVSSDIRMPKVDYQNLCQCERKQCSLSFVVLLNRDVVDQHSSVFEQIKRNAIWNNTAASSPLSLLSVPSTSRTKVSWLSGRRTNSCESPFSNSSLCYVFCCNCASFCFNF